MISILIPAHNEEKRIGRTLEEYGRFFQEKKKNRGIRDFEIVVVLNACRDRTKEVVEDARRRYPEIKYLEFEIGGKGFAIIEGFKYSLRNKNELIGFVDADLATPPEAFYELIKNIKNHDGIIASRWVKGSVIETRQGFLRKVMSWGFNFIVRSMFMLPFIDTQCGAKLFKREALERVIGEIGMTGWAFDVELLYKIRKNKFRVKEHPTIWRDKKESKLNLTVVPILMFLSIARLRLLNSPFKFIVRLYDNMPRWVKVHYLLMD